MGEVELMRAWGHWRPSQAQTREDRAAAQEVHDEMLDLSVEGLMAGLRLSQYAVALRELGVDAVDDFQHLDVAEDLDEVGMKKIHWRKFIKKMRHYFFAAWSDARLFSELCDGWNWTEANPRPPGEYLTNDIMQVFFVRCWENGNKPNLYLLVKITRSRTDMFRRIE